MLRLCSKPAVRVLLALAAFAVLSQPATAIKTPATPTPDVLWGQFLQPADPPGVPLPATRDSTGFTEFREQFFEVPWWMSVDIENGWIFIGGAHNVQVWDARSNPAAPSFMGQTNPFALEFGSGEGVTGWPARDLDLPPGVDTVGAQVGSGMGFAVYNFTNKKVPEVKYQQRGELLGLEVHAATINSRHYAFGAMDSNGLRVYDMSTALGFSNRCVDDLSGVKCGSVYKGRAGTLNAGYVDGVEDLVVASATFGKVEIWDFGGLPKLPPTPKLTGLAGEALYGVALWRDGGNIYMAVAGTDASRRNIEARIYDVSCVQTACGSLGAPIWRETLSPNLVSRNFVTFSTSNGAPFLYFGNENRLGGGPQREFLFDVSNPRGPVEISSKTTAVLQGAETDYWSWYYEGNPTGFSNVGPRRGKFLGPYFYRAGWAIFDIHQLVGSVAPQANFSWASTASDANVYPDVPVNFFDTSLGEPDSWSWSFQNAVPASSSTQSPQGVVFSSPGSKAVTLRVGNGVGNDSVTQEVSVLDPTPAVASVTANISDIQQCQPVTFSANDVTGRPPLSYGWRILDSQDLAVAIGTTAETFQWQTSAGTFPGAYRAEVTIDGPGGTSTPVLSSPVTVIQEDVPASFTPFHDPFEGASVSFHVDVPGAAAWRWSFGDNTGTDWITDPVEGPNPPPHVYQKLGTYDVTVEVRDCAETVHTSEVLTVEITSLTVVRGSFRPSPPLGCNFSTRECTWEAQVPLPFTDESSESVTRWSYDWNGDGQFEDANRTRPATSHIYPAQGVFTPRLKVSAGTQEYIFPDDDPDHDGFTITILPASNTPDPSITVSAPSSALTGQPVTFTATARDCNPRTSGWTWSASGGGSVVPLSTTSTQSQVSITWLATGVKSVSVTNTDCGSARGSDTISITAPDGGGDGKNLKAAFSVNPASPGVGQTVTFDASASTGSPQSYLWNFGDRSTGSGPVVQHSYAEAGAYSVTLTVSKPGDCGPLGCFDEITRTVRVGLGGTAPSLAITGPSTGTVGQDLNFAATASNCTPNAGGWNWSAPGAVISGSGSAVSVSWNSAGAKNLTVTNTGCGGATGSKTVNIAGTGEDLEAIFSFSPPNPQPESAVRFDASASRGKPTEFTWNFGDGSTDFSPDPIIEHTFSKEGSYTVTLTVTRPGFEAGCFGGFCFDEVEATVVVGGDVPPSIGCAGDPKAVCLVDGRFKVTVDWRNPRPDGGEGRAEPIPINPLPGQDTTGFFWFFSENSTDLIVKMIDGRAINQSFWFFYGALTDVEYTITVEDLDTQRIREYSNPPFEICGRADTQAFVEESSQSSTATWVADQTRGLPNGVVVPLNFSTSPGSAIAADHTGEVLGGTCEGDSSTLCLLDGRFELQVEWINPRDDGENHTGIGRAIQGSEETGYFWFFEPSTIELVVKMIDGRDVNGKIWFFFGGLSDVEYKIFVSDTVEGTVREYVNPAFEICGQADVEAFE